MADQLKFYVHDHIAAAAPLQQTVPVAFEKDRRLGAGRPAAMLRMTVDGKATEFWLAAFIGYAVMIVFAGTLIRLLVVNLTERSG